MALNPLDFRPLPREAELQQSLSVSRGEGYWAGVWRRLLANPRAVGSMLILSTLFAFTLLGPLVWTASPYQQTLGQSSLLPSFSAQALLVDEDNWQAPLRDTVSDTGFKLEVLEAHTEWVRLRWEPVTGATAYRIYRHEREPISESDLGLPLGATRSGAVVGYEDRMNLREQTYVYTVVAVDDLGERIASARTSVNPVLAIGRLEAQLQGLLEEGLLQESDGGSEYLTLSARPLGTDSLGRDMLARLMMGAQTSLFIGIVAPLLFVLLGTLYGAVAGYLGGWVDNLMMRFADFVIALPFLLFMILLKIAFGIGPGESGIWPMLVALLLLSWPGTARLVRAQVLQLREQPYVEAARLSGAGTFYLITRHMLPNVLGVVLVSLSFAIPGAIFTEAFLSFIGMGVAPPTPSWGSMSQDGMKTLLSYPHELLLPSLFISVTVLAFNLFGDALRDALDAKLE